MWKNTVELRISSSESSENAECEKCGTVTKIGKTNWRVTILKISIYNSVHHSP